MRGRTYKFADYGISIDHPFKIYYSGSFSGTISGGSGGTGYIDVTIPSDHSTTLGDLYYQCNNHPGMKVDLELFYRPVSESDVFYDFYYGDITVVVSGDFSSVSIYCYYHRLIWE